jgi:hypothetical protein
MKYNLFNHPANITIAHSKSGENDAFNNNNTNKRDFFNSKK